jgi:membrane-associated phospholipid phosphatase
MTFRISITSEARRQSAGIDTELRFGIAVLACAGVVFALVAYGLVRGEWLPLIDERIAAWVHVQRSAALTIAMLVVTYAHGVVAVASYSLLVAVALALRRERGWALTVFATVWSGLGVNMLIKQVFARPRPELGEPVLTLTTYSFPSGHTAATALFYGVIAAYLISRYDNMRVRVTCAVGWPALVLLVGYSRVYLGVHYPTDVLAAAAWSSAWVALCVMIHRKLNTTFPVGK